MFCRVLSCLSIHFLGEKGDMSNKTRLSLLGGRGGMEEGRVKGRGEGREDGRWTILLING